MVTTFIEAYYPVVFIDAIHIKVHRKRSVETEAFYAALGVKEDKSQEVLGILIVQRKVQQDGRRCFVSLNPGTGANRSVGG